jgi:hypothetical protein
MYLPIEQMPDDSRVWIYQANRALTAAEIQQVASILAAFCDQWAAHQVALQTSFSIDHNRFVVLAVNERASAPSGCSIDSSVHVLKSLEQTLGIDFFSRSEIAFSENGEIMVHPIQNLKNLFASGRLNENSLALNSLVQTLGEWRNQGTVKVSDTWLKRYIPKIPVS